MAKCLCIRAAALAAMVRSRTGHTIAARLIAKCLCIIITRSRGEVYVQLICGIATGFAFIEFEDPRDAEDAVRDMDGRYVCGVRIRCEMAKNSSRFD